MNYKTVYNQIIEYRKNILPVGYAEKHHIIPKCMGGSNSKDNLVYLTAREHYICHKLLTKFVDLQFKPKMIYAWHRMSTSNKNDRNLRITSHDYESMRQQFSIEISKMNSGTKHPMFGKHHTIQARKSMSSFRKGKVTYMKGKTHSEETKRKMSNAHAGKNNSNFGKLGLNNPNFGSKRCAETKQKMSIAQKDRKFSDVHRDKLSKAKIKKLNFKAISCFGLEIISNSPNQFAKDHNLNIAHVFNCLYGKRNSHKGWKFEKL